MDNALIGFLVVFGFLHFLLVVIPVMNVLQTKISIKSKLAWCGVILFLPLIGVAIMHFRYKTGLFQGKAYEVSAAEERARSGTLAPRDDD
jgi:hypothetical protein